MTEHLTNYTLREGRFSKTVCVVDGDGVRRHWKVKHNSRKQINKGDCRGG